MAVRRVHPRRSIGLPSCAGGGHQPHASHTSSARRVSDGLYVATGRARRGRCQMQATLPDVAKPLPRTAWPVFRVKTRHRKAGLFAGLPMRPSGLEPPRGNLPTRPSTSYTGASYVCRRPERPNSARSRTHRTHLEQRVLPRCCHAHPPYWCPLALGPSAGSTPRSPRHRGPPQAADYDR
jgi:hypothetical protein